MGTSLTGLTPATTYDALIKVGDNGPLSATAKYLSDGLGNDAPMSMSTSRVGIGTDTPAYNLHINAASDSRIIITDSAQGSTANDGTYIRQSGLNSSIVNQENGTLQFGTNNSFVQTILANGNVGIGTSSPLAKLQSTTAGTGVNEVALRLNNPNGNVAPTGVDIVLQSGYTTGVDGAAVIRGGRNTAGTDSYITFQTNSGSGLAEVGRWLPTGGLTFNGDTAAANALDDYEEGTFTATMTGTVSNPTTPVTTTGTYTKIGRQVTVNVIFDNVNTTGAAGGVRITGLPFSCGFTGGVGAVILELFDFTAGRTSVASYVNVSSPTTIFIEASGSNSSFGGVAHSAGAGRYLYTSLTYFV
jgi:hypothetical protein